MNWKLTLKKVIVSGIQAALAVVSGPAVSGALSKVGVTVSVDPVIATGAAYGGLEVVRNFLKHKVGSIFRYL